jgi:hypothetical protein
MVPDEFWQFNPNPNLFDATNELNYTNTAASWLKDCHHSPQLQLPRIVRNAAPTFS